MERYVKAVSNSYDKIKIFDLGSNTFKQTRNLIKSFEKLGKIKEVHTFEAQKNLGLSNLEKLKKDYPLINFIHNNKPVWKEDGFVHFYESKYHKEAPNHRGGSSLIPHNKTTYSKPTFKKAINFIKYFENYSSRNHYNFIKIDIEGAEYEILPELLKSAFINNLNEISCEWHAWMYKDTALKKRYKAIEIDIKKQIQTKSIKISNWF